MFDLKELQAARKQVNSRDTSRASDADKAMDEAHKCLERFFKDPRMSKDNLVDAADNLIKSLEIKRSQPEPYAYLAYIYYVLKQDHLAIKYLNIAKSKNPDLPVIIKLQQILSTNVTSLSANPVITHKEPEPLITNEKNVNGEKKKISPITRITRLK